MATDIPQLALDDITDTVPLLRNGRLFYRYDFAEHAVVGKLFWEIILYRNGTETLYPRGNLIALQGILSRECPSFPGADHMIDVVIPSLHTLYNGLGGSIVGEKFYKRLMRRGPPVANAVNELRRECQVSPLKAHDNDWSYSYYALHETKSGADLYECSMRGLVEPLAVVGYSVALTKKYPAEFFGEMAPR